MYHITTNVRINTLQTNDDFPTFHFYVKSRALFYSRKLLTKHFNLYSYENWQNIIVYQCLAINDQCKFFTFGVTWFVVRWIESEVVIGRLNSCIVALWEACSVLTFNRSTYLYEITKTLDTLIFRNYQSVNISFLWFKNLNQLLLESKIKIDSVIYLFFLYLWMKKNILFQRRDRIKILNKDIIWMFHFKHFVLLLYIKTHGHNFGSNLDTKN